MTGKLIDFAAFKAKKQSGEGGSTALARATEDKPAKPPSARRRAKKKASKKPARKKAQPRIKSSRAVFVRCTKATSSHAEYKSECGWLTLDRVDKVVVRATFDPILDDDMASLDIDTDSCTYDAEKSTYTVRDVDDGCLWRFTRLKKVKA